MVPYPPNPWGDLVEEEENLEDGDEEYPETEEEGEGKKAREKHLRGKEGTFYSSFPLSTSGEERYLALKKKKEGDPQAFHTLLWSSQIAPPFFFLSKEGKKKFDTLWRAYLEERERSIPRA